MPSCLAVLQMVVLEPWQPSPRPSGGTKILQRRRTSSERPWSCLGFLLAFNKTRVFLALALLLKFPKQTLVGRLDPNTACSYEHVTEVAKELFPDQARNSKHFKPLKWLYPLWAKTLESQTILSTLEFARPSRVTTKMWSFRSGRTLPQASKTLPQV